MLLKLLIIFLVSVISTCEKIRYDNFSLFKIHPQTEKDIKFLNELPKNGENLHIWKLPSTVGDYASVVSSPEKKASFEHSLRKRSINYEVMMENIQQAFDDQIMSRKRRDTRRQLFWTSYQTLEDIYEWFHYLAEQHSDIVTIIQAGQSFEGRNITGVKISRQSGKRAIFIEGGQVGADWLSPTIATYIVDQLVRGAELDILEAAEEFEWHIFPIVNPDGHEYTNNADRLWLKNRRPTMGGSIGVDITKNWNSHWGVRGVSFAPADTNYAGLGPFSEVETRAISNYIDSIGAKLAGLLSFRGFGQRLLLPFAHTTSHMYNYNETIIVGRRAMGSLAVRYNTQYLVGNSMEVHDGATGTIADWVKHRFNPPLVATYQLRDTGSFGYTLPVVQVQPSCEETFDSVMALIREAKHVGVL